jgi:hypothetical protein
LKATFNKAQTIVRFFHKSHLQLSHLQEIQIDKYGNLQSFVLFVITQWDTQYLLVNLVNKNKQALRSWAFKYQVELLALVKDDVVAKDVLEFISKDSDF